MTAFYDLYTPGKNRRYGALFISLIDQQRALIASPRTLIVLQPRCPCLSGLWQRRTYRLVTRSFSRFSSTLRRTSGPSPGRIFAFTRVASSTPRSWPRSLRGAPYSHIHGEVTATCLDLNRHSSYRQRPQAHHCARTNARRQAQSLHRTLISHRVATRLPFCSSSSLSSRR